MTKWTKSDVAIVAALEVTPPGYEDVVQALKTKSSVDNPWAVAWSMKGKGAKLSKKTKHEAKTAAPKSAKAVKIHNLKKDNKTVAHKKFKAERITRKGMKNGDESEQLAKGRADQMVSQLQDKRDYYDGFSKKTLSGKQYQPKG